MRTATEFFDEEMIQLIESMHLKDSAVQLRRARIALLDLQPGERVIDIGTGPGFYPYDMAGIVGPAGDVLGVDINEPMLELARRRCADMPQVRFETADATQLPAPDDSFDAAVSVQVFEYIPDVEAALAELYRVLRPGGRALITATDWKSNAWNSSDEERMQRVLSAFSQHCPHHVLPRILAPKFRSAGLEVRDQQISPIFEHYLEEDSYSSQLMGFIRSFVPGHAGVSEAEADDWVADLRQLSERGEYFFSINRYLFIVGKPAEL